MTDQQKAFADFWLDNGHNQTQAAISAQYSPDTAYSQGNRLLKHVEVSEYLGVELKKRRESREVILQRWVDALEAIAYAEVDQVVDIKTGDMKEGEIPFDVRRAIESVGTDSKGKRRVTMANKTRALELLGRHHAFLRDDDKTGVTIIFAANEKDGLI